MSLTVFVLAAVGLPYGDVVTVILGVATVASGVSALRRHQHPSLGLASIIIGLFCIHVGIFLLYGIHGPR